METTHRSLLFSLVRILANARIARICSVAFLLALLFAGNKAAAQEVSDFSAMFGYGPYYAANRWMPIRFRLRNTSANAYDSFCCIVPVADPSGNLTIRVHAKVPPNAVLVATGYGCFPDHPAATPKKGNVPPLTITQWLIGGNRVGRCEILGRAAGAGLADGASGVGDSSGGEAGGRLLLVLNSPAGVPAAPTGDPRVYSSELARLKELVNDETNLATLAGSFAPWRFATAFVPSENAPRELIGYDSAAIVVIENGAAALLDPAQQTALLQFVRAGGAVVVAAPSADDAAPGTWLDQYLPVHVIGPREIARIEPLVEHETSTKPMLLRTVTRITEAVAKDADPAVSVLLRDDKYAYAAARRVGLGRIIFTSFPPGAIDPADARYVKLWRDLLGTDDPSCDWSRSRLEADGPALLQQMIGQPAASWARAASVAGGYAVLVLILQMVFSGTRRPMAFVASLIAAVVGCGGLLAATSVHQHQQVLSAARLSTFDFGPFGGGLRQEEFALAGRDDVTMPLAVGPDAWLKGSGSGSSPVEIDMPPFSTPDAGVHAGRIDHVWQALGPIGGTTLTNHLALYAHAQFKSDGLHLDVDNNLEATVHAPLLIWGGARFRLKDLATGHSETTPSARNTTAGDYSNTEVLATDETHLRNDMLAAASAAPSEALSLSPQATARRIAGWLDAQPSGQLISTGTPVNVRELAMARTNVALNPSTIGETVHVAGAFSRVTSATRSLPFDYRTGTWNSDTQNESWLIAFPPPAEIGTIHTLRAVIHADLTAPSQHVSLRRGQCVNGRVKENSTGTIVADWPTGSGVYDASIECSENDLDANGWLWLRLQVQAPELTGSGPVMLTPWKFNSLELDADVQVTGPPQTPITTWPVDEPVIAPRPNPVVKPPTKAAKPPATKPAKTPTTKPKPAPKPKPQPG